MDLEQIGQRRVSHEEGEALANKFGCKFIETSAAHRRHVDDVFHVLVREIRRQQVIHPDRIYNIASGVLLLINPLIFQHEEQTKESDVSRWRKLWTSIMRKTKRRKNKE